MVLHRRSRGTVHLLEPEQQITPCGRFAHATLQTTAIVDDVTCRHCLGALERERKRELGTYARATAR